MGNTMEQAGFGDTRLSDPGDNEETTDLPDLNDPSLAINAGDYTYRNGVNYKKDDKENIGSHRK